MPKRISENDLDNIVNAVGTFPDGVGVEQIHSALEGKVPRRTLQRRLALLVKQKRLFIKGRARASRYHLLVSIDETQQRQIVEKQVARGEFHIPLSLQGKKIRKIVRKPVQSRNPVGYNRVFLYSYQPNSTFYLSSEIRQSLYELGRSPEEQHTV